MGGHPLVEDGPIPLNKLDFIVFDFETGGLSSEYHEAVQVAGKAYNWRTLQPYPVDQGGGEFCSLMKPLYPDRLQDEALRVNGKTREMLAAAPGQKEVWQQFVDWVGKWNPKKSKFGAPIAAGKNIRNFDMGFVHALNRLHMPKGEKTVLFSDRLQLELEDFILHWFGDDDELPNMKMDTLRDYFGMSKEGAHDALTDVRQTGELLVKFLTLHRTLKQRKRTLPDGQLVPLISFRGACERTA